MITHTDSQDNQLMWYGILDSFAQDSISLLESAEKGHSESGKKGHFESTEKGHFS